MLLLAALAAVAYLLGAACECALGTPLACGWAPGLLFRRALTGALIAGWVGVALAEWGAFAPDRLLALLAAVALTLSALAARRGTLTAIWRFGHWMPRRDLAVLLLLVVASAMLFGQPGEDVLGARDPGIYFATGVAIARGGGVLQHDATLALLAADLGDGSINYWLFQSVHGWPLRFPGQLFVRDLSQGTVEPGFLPWYPVWIATAVGSAGIGAGPWVNPVLTALAVFAVYLAGRELLGGWAAAIGAALLTLNLAQVWFARYTMAEPALQLLVWTGLYAVAAARRRPAPALGLLAGLAWGSAPLARVEAVLLLPIVALYLWWEARQTEHRAWASTALAGLALGVAHWLAHAVLFAPGYATMVFSRATLAVAAGGIALVLVVGAVLWTLLVWWRPARPRARASAVVALVALGAGFAYLARPLLPTLLAAGQDAELEVAARESLVRLGWYVTPLGLLLAGAGSAALVWDGAWRRAVPLLALTALSLAFYLPNPLVSADQPWAARRYLPLLLPALFLLAGYGVVRVAALLPTRLPGARAILAVGLVLVVAGGEWQSTAPLLSHREHAGALGQIAALAARFPADAIVLFPRSSDGMRLSLPLQYVGGRATFVLPAEGPVADVLDVATRWRAAGRPVYWVVPLGTRFPTPRGVRFVPDGQFVFEVPQLERPLDRLPRDSEPLRFELQVFRLELAAEARGAPLLERRPQVLDEAERIAGHDAARVQLHGAHVRRLVV